MQLEISILKKVVSSSTRIAVKSLANVEKTGAMNSKTGPKLKIVENS